MKKFKIFGIIVGLIASFWLYTLFSSSVDEEKGVIYYLKPGTSKKAAIAELAQLGIIKHPLLFSLYAYPHADAGLKTGEYLFPKGASLASIWRQITTGTGLAYHPFIIIPGWSFKQLCTALSQAEGLRNTISNLNNQQIMQKLGYTNLPEGEFFPETYLYTKGIADTVILKRAANLMQTKLNQAWLKRAPNLPYKTPYQVLIAASLIEKEAKLDYERPIIAGVLVNRLRKNMLLQFDPTVIYGMGDRYQGKIRKSNLSENTPYNTYVHLGLPPTPIAMPSMDSINTALHPQQNDFYYFVARGDGSHQFSKSLVEHNAAVSKIVKGQLSYYYFNNEMMNDHIHSVFNVKNDPGMHAG